MSRVAVARAESTGGEVPLSEHEQRQLEQIEQALYADHPRLAKVMRARDPKVHYRRRVIQAAICFLLGVGIVVAGVILKYPWLDGIGLIVMLASTILAVASYRRMSGILMPRSRAPGQSRRTRRQNRRAARAGSSSGLMEKIEERWRRRQEGNR